MSAMKLSSTLAQLASARERLPVPLHRIVDTLIDVAETDGRLSAYDMTQARALIVRADAGNNEITGDELFCSGTGAEPEIPGCPHFAKNDKSCSNPNDCPHQVPF